jgi:hypothetical protein
MDQIVQLANQDLGNLLKDNPSADEIIREFGDFSPYMNNSQKQAFINQLMHIGLTAKELGLVFFGFDDFGLDPQALSSIIMEYFPSENDVANFLHELSLDPDVLGQIINLLPLNWRISLQSQITTLDEETEAYYEGQFQGFSGSDLIDFVQQYLQNPPDLFPTLESTPTLSPTFEIPDWPIPSQIPSLPFHY